MSWRDIALVVIASVILLGFGTGMAWALGVMVGRLLDGLGL